MLKKIILPVVLLIFAQQNFYGMEKKEEEENENNDIKKQHDFWSGVNDYMNKDKLAYLWVFLDNVPFQYGGSKIWKHGEAYYGLSNGIGFFPSFLNFGWLKVGIGDTHINVINTIIKYIKAYTAITYDYYCCRVGEVDILNSQKNPVWLNSLKWWLFYTVVTDIHLFSFKIFNCVKIKIISIGAFVSTKIIDYLPNTSDHSWYFSFIFLYRILKVPSGYFIFSPRIEINIPGIIDYFKKS